MTTVSGVNIKEIPAVIDTVVEQGADVFAFARYCPTSGEKDTGMTSQEYRELLDTCYLKFKEYEATGCSTYFNKKTISGRFTSMRKVFSKSRRAQRTA